ncbi:MAG TPA: GAF domain-containing sensor histidine kinase [Anaerolineae bacterium]|nr:GAF domain-containing sensor histidine kinase [Anaerolineae bacterium]MCB0179095.1 GAF domain-containing sensor histidine kinase [Anaerolineae bacterium]MCB0224313.1 GAF domain-containing sensor histidine kinase [Anaerolineae bacterium]HRV90706.1 GAF domain-containing sensor histidine kinase [Anaerolineae bacterium]
MSHTAKNRVELKQPGAEQKRVEEILQQRNRELALISQASQLFTSTLELEQVLEIVLSGTHNLLNITATSFWLRIPETGELVCQHAIGAGAETVIGWRLAEGQGLAGWAAQTGQSLLVPDAKQDSRHFGMVDQQSGINFRSILSIPLRTRRGVIGVLNLVDTEVGRFTEDELSLVDSIATAAAIAIENARLYQEAQEEIAQRKLIETILRERNEELDAFAHTVAHNLKNPLSTAIGYTDFLLFDPEAVSPKELNDCLQIIKSAGKKAVSIIDELLLLATVRKNETEHQPLNMTAIIEQVQERLQPMIKEYQAEISVPPIWPTALGYAPWVEEVWTNYITNGLKYGGSPPKLELGANLDESNMVCFWVRDSGPGLSEADQIHLFIEFNRLNRVGTKGHGLGLSIVKRIVEKLGGQVGVQSEPDQGSIFFFTLPMAANISNGVKGNSSPLINS